jgi:hypothetical protein
MDSIDFPIFFLRLLELVVRGTAANPIGWQLVSEKWNQVCALGGSIGAGTVLRIWAMTEDAGQGDLTVVALTQSSKKRPLL